MGIITIVGPPAVGKMTVGQAIAEKTGYKLFHNHMSIDMVLPIFPFGTDAFWNSVNQIRLTIFKEAAKAKHHKGIIFTFCWDFEDEKDTDFAYKIKEIFNAEGKPAMFLELYSDIDTRLKRNRTPNRLEHKPTKRDLEWSDQNVREMDKKYSMNTNGHQQPIAHFLRLDNTQITPSEAADMFVKHFAEQLNTTLREE